MIGWLLVRLSGVDAKAAKAQGEQRRYAIYGGLVLFTTGMATLSMAWAVSIATDAPPLVVAAAAGLWGFGILHIDQWLVSSHVEHDGVWRRLWLLVPRLAIAIPMGLTIAWFVMLAIASKEIDQQLKTDQITLANTNGDLIRDGYQRQRDDLVAERGQLEQARQQAQRQFTAAQRAYDDERSGRGGSGEPGHGPIAAAKLRAWRDAEVRLDEAEQIRQTRTPEIDEELRTIDRQINQRRAEATATVNASDGLFARRTALEHVMDRDSGARRLFTLLEVVFVVVDVVPAVAKVFSPTSLVDLAHRARKREKTVDGTATAEAERDSPELDAARRYAAARKAARIRADADAVYPDPARRGATRRSRREQRGLWSPY